MQKTTNISLGDHFDTFIARQIQCGRYASASEVVCAGLGLIEERETKLEVLRGALKEGEVSGPVDYSLNDLLAELDAEGAP
jgi:antitoxin ParD1/3/4